MKPTSPPARVLFLDHTSQLGGAERSMLDLFAHLDRAVVTPRLVTSAGGPLVERAEALDVPVTTFALEAHALELSREAWAERPLSVLWHARGYMHEVFRLARLVKRERIDWIHSNTLKAHVLGSLVAKLAGVPIVWHMRDLPSTRGDARNLLNGLARLVHPHVIAISQAVADDLPAAMRDRTRVVYNGIDVAAFRKRAAEPGAPLAPEGAGPLLGAVSHLIPWKGHEVFLRAIATLAPRHPDWRFAIVGDPIFQFRDERDRLEAIARELGIADRVAFAGHREDVPAVLGQLSLFVLPSLYEPFGRVLIEAMAAGLPIVASRAGGVPEIVVEGETGLLVPPGDAGALASAIEAVMGDPALAARLATAGSERVERCFSLTATVQGVLAAYRAFGLLP